MIYLALRKTSPPGFFAKIFTAITKARLLTKYPHGGIVVGDTLYHSTLRNGLHSEKFDPHGWDLFQIDATAADVLRRFAGVAGAKYDWFSLLAFALPFRIRMSRWFYCFEWCHFAITGRIATVRVTPEDLLFYSKGVYANVQP